MTNNFLLLNSDKTEILLIGPKNSTQNLLDYNLQLDGCNVTSSTVKNLGVILDSNLSFENHISNVTKTAFFHLRNIAKLRNMLSVSDAEKLVHTGRGASRTSVPAYCCHNRYLQHGLGHYMQWTGCLGALDGALTALAHQLPRAVDSASSLTAVPATAVGQARASPH